MKYVCTFRVHPERAAVRFRRLTFEYPEEGWHAVIVCEGSQLIVTLVDRPELDSLETAAVLAKQVGELFVGALGFSLGAGYSVEIFQVTNQNAETKIFGAGPLGAKLDETLQVAPDSEVIFNQAAQLSTHDLSFRLAIRDYLQAITNTKDGAFYCYRSMEAIKSTFQGKTDREQWNAMHSALGTDRNEIMSTVKPYADLLRHGRPDTRPMTFATYQQMLRLTQDVLVRYMNHCELAPIVDEPGGVAGRF